MESTSLRDLLSAPEVIHTTAANMGLESPIEALLCAPTRYEDFRVIHDDFSQLYSQAYEGMPFVYRAKVRATNSNVLEPSIRGYARKGVPVPANMLVSPNGLLLSKPFGRYTFRLEIDIEDAQGRPAVQSVFGAVWGWKDIKPGDEIVLKATMKRFADRWSFSDPEMVSADQVGKINPVYLGLAGKNVNSASVTYMMQWLKQNDDRLALAISRACDRIRMDCGNLPDEQILELCSRPEDKIRPATLEELLVHLHFPQESVEEGMGALQIVRRICVLSAQCIAQRTNTRAPHPLARLAPSNVLVAEANKQIARIEQVKQQRIPSFRLTDNQRQVIEQICTKLGEGTPLNGLLSGEVGAGKTMAYAVPAVVAHQTGSRVAIMAPTDLLADQIARNIADEFGPAVAVERVTTGRKIRNPDAILVGTIGLNTAAKKSGWKPNLLIFDEQHKLHTAARDELIESYTHTLEVSATPIPRSLALSMYSGMDIFVLNEQPVVKDIQTGLLDAKDRRIATAAIRQALADGKRVAIVYTLVDSNTESLQDDESISEREKKRREESNRSSAIQAAELLEKHFPGQVVLLHGKMKADEKIQALDRYRSGESNLMVTTTIFETGIDVPDVQLIVIRDPEHLGLSQLHQLRGRTARSGGLGLCLLLTEDLDTLNDETYARLRTFCQTTDGYELAHQDMLQRGVGQFDGLQQNGHVSMVFKSVKMSTAEILNLEEGHADLEVSAELVEDHVALDEAAPTQQRLFT